MFVWLKLIRYRDLDNKLFRAQFQSDLFFCYLQVIRLDSHIGCRGDNLDISGNVTTLISQLSDAEV